MSTAVMRPRFPHRAHAVAEMPSTLVPAGDERLVDDAGDPLRQEALRGVVRPPELTVRVERAAGWADPVAAEGVHHGVVVVDDEVRPHVYAQLGQLRVVIVGRFPVAGHDQVAQGVPEYHFPSLPPPRPDVDAMAVISESLEHVA